MTIADPVELMPDTPARAAAHQRLLDEITAEAAATASWTGRSHFSGAVMAALAKVRRDAFVPRTEWPFAYDNRPLGIGHGQTISQPYIVALMTDLLDLTADDRVLEIGTGCGYQAAVLALLAARVYTVEVVPELADAARHRLAQLGYDNVATRAGDGWRGWAEAAPFDAIIVTAAPTEVPAELVKQLTPGGRLVIPIGPRYDTQTLYRGVKRADGTLAMEEKLPVAFVPMIRPN
jgi:protein-L-isoaspartate(D-aspartate) O-methyltransferase